MWYFEEQPPLGGAPGSAYRAVLAGAAGFTAEAKLAREAIQNSCDASQQEHGDRSAPPVKIVFHKRSLKGDEKRRWVETLTLQKKGGPVERTKKLGLNEKNSFATIQNLNEPLHVMIVEDWNTIGLGGPAAQDANDAHFWRLLFTVGDPSKALLDDPSGGSYGFGKGVYSGTADTFTFIAYSSFKPSVQTEHKSTRLLGCGFFDKHTVTGTHFTGRAWFAKAGSQKKVQPFVDAEAHVIAKALGLTPRENGKAGWGTTLVILGFDADMDKLRKGVEDYWWPRIIDNQLQVELRQDGKLLEHPKPRQRADLKPLLLSYALAVGTSEPRSASERQGELGDFQDIRLGSWGATAVDVLETDKEENDDFEETLQPTNSIALIRRPKMVVEYYSPFRKLTSDFAAVFIADDAADRILKLAEPPAHDEWNPASDRLKKISNANATVKTLLWRLRQQVRKFANSLTPPPPPRDGRFRSLERELGRLFNKYRVREPRPVPPPRQFEAVTIETDGPVFHDDQGRTKVSWTVSFGLNEAVDVVAKSLRAQFRLVILADDNKTTDDELGFWIEAGPDVAKLDDGSVSFQIDKDSKEKIRITSDAYDPRWLTDLIIETEAVDAGDQHA